LNHPVKALYWTIGEINESGTVKDKLVFGMRDQEEEACGKCAGCLNGNSFNDEVLLACVGELNAMSRDTSASVVDFTKDVASYKNLNTLFERLNSTLSVPNDLESLFGGLFSSTKKGVVTIAKTKPTIEDAANAILALVSQDTTWLFDETKTKSLNPESCLMPNLKYSYNEVVKSATLLLNNNQRFAERHGSYFNQLQPLFHHSNVPARGIYMYSFCLNPEDVQPSGSCNFSRIDNACLKLEMETNSSLNKRLGVTSASRKSGTMKQFAIHYYGVNINVFRVFGGLGGISWAS